MMHIEQLIRERNALRNRWHAVRTERLQLKNSLLAEEKSIYEVRHNGNYKKLKKEQRLISRMIKHIENKIPGEIVK